MTVNIHKLRGACCATFFSAFQRPRTIPHLPSTALSTEEMGFVARSGIKTPTQALELL